MISGDATPLVYQQALASVVYFNEAPEPTKAQPRLVQFRVFDGIFSSDLLTASVSISLVNDNPVTLDCGSGVFNFTEGSSEPTLIATELSLVDRDANHVISYATVTLFNQRLGDAISVDTNAIVNGITATVTNTQIDLVGNAMSSNYQVSRACEMCVCVCVHVQVR